MSLKTILNGVPEHVQIARHMAEEIFNHSPDIQLEMLKEVKDSLIKRTEIKMDKLKEV